MDRELDFLKRLAHGLSVQFGSSCEVVIKDLTKEDSVCISDPGQDRFSYLTKTSDGRLLKSSTFYFRDDNGNICYTFSINYDITALAAAENALSSLTRTESDSSKKSKNPDSQDLLTYNVNELLDILIEQAVRKVGKPVALMNKNDKTAVVRYLNDAGAFLITKSGDKISSLLGISKFTLYSYMDKE